MEIKRENIKWLTQDDMSLTETRGELETSMSPRPMFLYILLEAR